MSIKEVKGYPNYRVHNTGFVVNRHDTQLKKILHNGYYVCTLYGDGTKVQKRIHILVAEAFIPNPDNKPQVNHKDGNPLNNHVDNLYWGNQSENMLDMYGHGYINPLRKAVFQFTKDGEFIKEFCSMSHASESIGIHRAAIGNAIRRNGSSGGYKWKYKLIN